MLRGQRDGSAGPRGRSGTLSSRTSTYSGSPCGPATPAQRRRRGWPRVPAVTASRLPPVSPPGGRARLDAGVRAGAAGFLWSPCRLVSYWWAAGGAVQNLSDWDRSRPAPQGRRLHHFHRHARPHRAHHLGLHRRRAEPDTGDPVGAHRRPSQDAAGSRRRGPPLRLSRDGPRPAEPAVHRAGVPDFPGRDGVLEGLWAAVAGGVLVWRGALPLSRNARHRRRVAAVVPEGPGSSRRT